MRLKFRSWKRRLYDRIHYEGRWHQIFAWLPRIVDYGDGNYEIVWLQKVARKSKIYLKENSNGKELCFKPRYRLPEDLTFEILEKGEEDKIEFDGYYVRQKYIDLKMDLNIRDKESYD